MAVCVSKAQTTLSRYDIRYSTEHHVLAKDGYVNVQVTCQKDGQVTYTCKNIDQTMEYEPCKTTHIVTLKHDTMEYSTLVGEYTEKYHNWKEVVEKKLQVVDLTASILAMENHMPMYVFSLNEKDSIVNTINGNFNGTRVTV